MRKHVYWANTSCAANRATLIQAVDSKTDRQMDGWILGAMWSSCPLLDLVNRAACQNDHTWCPSICLCLSTQSLHPVLREPITPLHTQTHAHILCGTHTHKRRMGYCTEKKVVHSFSHPVLPVAQTFSQLSPKLFLFSALLLSQRPASFSHLHLPTGREQQREVQKAPWPSLLHLPSRWDFPHPSTDLCFVLTFD